VVNLVVAICKLKTTTKKVVFDEKSAPRGKSCTKILQSSMQSNRKYENYFSIKWHL